jgi:hypothetical protein
MDETEKKSRLILYLLAGLIILSCAYSALQHVIFSKRYEQNFLNVTHVLEQRFTNILKKYKTVLSEFSKEIKKKNLFLDSAELSELFEKSYTYGSSDLNGEKIHLSAINWVDKSGNLTIGRFGVLLSPLAFSPDYLEKLKRNPGKLEISNLVPEAGTSEPPITNLGIGVDDDKEVYKGFVNVRVHSQTLLDSMMSLKTEVDVQVILLDQSAHVLGSSIALTADDKKSAGEIVKKHNGGRFSKADSVFTKMASIDESPYSLLFGYSTKMYLANFFDYLWPQLLCFFSCFFLFILFLHFYHLRKLKEGWKTLRKKNESLQGIVQKTSDQHYQLNEKRKTLEEELKCRAESDREQTRLSLEVNKRISGATSDLLNAGNVLLERVNYQEELEENPQEIMNIFERAYFHACFMCTKSTEEPVDIVDLLDKSLKIHSYKTVENQIVLRKKIAKGVKPILTDSLSLQQVMVNILGRVLKNIPTEGELEISIFEKKESLCIDFKDNGYPADDLSKNRTDLKEDIRSLDYQSLEWGDLQKLVRSLGGTLSYQHTSYQGNHFAFQLPYQFHKAYSPKKEIAFTKGGNIIPFSALKKNEKS